MEEVLNCSSYELWPFMHNSVTWQYCTFMIASCPEFVFPANKVRRLRVKVIIVRISMPISSGSCEAKGPTICIVNSQALW